MTATQLFPEEVLIAVLHKVGPDVRIAEDRELVRLFDEAARTHPDLFGAFLKHPFYPDSEGLTDALQALDLGGAIVRENAATGYFTVGKRTSGEYGETKFNTLGHTEQERVNQLAHKIREAYTSSNGASSTADSCTAQRSPASVG